MTPRWLQNERGIPAESSAKPRDTTRDAGAVGAPGVSIIPSAGSAVQRQPNGHLLLLILGLLVLAAIWWLAGKDAFEAQIIFLSWDEHERVQIFLVGKRESGTRQLTSSPEGVIDFALSPDGDTLVYSSNASLAGSELWQMDLDGDNPERLLSCPDVFCTAPAWHPDGVRLLYERRSYDAHGIPGFPQLWWLDTTSGDTRPLMADGARYSQGARFSPDGRWLSYVGTPDEGIQLYNFESGESHQISSSVGSPAVWSPDGQSILTRDRHLAVRHGAEGENHQDHSHEFSEGVALFVTQLAALDTTRLGGDDGADDGPPAWSADGAWIAFGRKSSRAEDGRQLWVIKPDGSQARALTESPELHHGAISWSADGSTLLFQRIDTRVANQRSGIWILNVSTGRTEELHTPGFQPAWIP